MITVDIRHQYVGDGDYYDYVLAWDGDRAYEVFANAFGGPAPSKPTVSDEIASAFVSWAIPLATVQRIDRLTADAQKVRAGATVVSTSKRSKKFPHGSTGVCGAPYTDGYGNTVVDIDTDAGRIWRVGVSQMQAVPATSINVEAAAAAVQAEVSRFVAAGDFYSVYWMATGMRK